MLAVIGSSVGGALAAYRPARDFLFTFPSINARLNAIGNPYLNKRNLYDLFIRGDVKSAVDAASSRNMPIEGIEMREVDLAILRSNASFVEDIMLAAPRSLRPFYKTFLMRYELVVVKQALKSLQAGEKVEIPEIGILTPQLLTEISTSVSPLDAANSYLSALGLPHIEGEGLWSICLNLDLEYLRHLVSVIEGMPRVLGKGPREFMMAMLDATLVRIAVALNMRSAPHVIGDLDIPEGEHVSRWMMHEIARDLSGLEHLRATPLERVIASADDPTRLDVILNTYLLDITSELHLRHFYTTGPGIRFLFGREMERRNLLTVFGSLASGMRWEEVEPLLILEVET